MMTLSIKKILLGLGLSGMTLAPLQTLAAEQTNIKEVRNEAGIMFNILQASLKQQRSNKNIRFRADAVFYLADQGVVFEIDSGRHGGDFFGFDLGSLNDLVSGLPPKPVKPPLPRTSHSHIDINIDEDEIEKMVMQFIEQGDHHDDYIQDKMRNEMRNISQKERKLAWEKREYERDRRDLEFEKRQADNDRRKNIDKRLAKLINKVDKLEIETNELEKYKSELEAEHNKEKAKRDAVKKKLYNDSLALFEDTIGDMLCRYGAGLRSLSENENITFLLSEFVEADGDSVIGSHDKVYVFKHKDVKACVAGQSDKNKLLTAAKTYLF